MGFLFRLTGILASVSTLILTVLDILDRHTNVDTQALLADIGGDRNVESCRLDRLCAKITGSRCVRRRGEIR